MKEGPARRSSLVLVGSSFHVFAKKQFGPHASIHKQTQASTRARAHRASLRPSCIHMYPSDRRRQAPQPVSVTASPGAIPPGAAPPARLPAAALVVLIGLLLLLALDEADRAGLPRAL